LDSKGTPTSHPDVVANVDVATNVSIYKSYHREPTPMRTNQTSLRGDSDRDRRRLDNKGTSTSDPDSVANVDVATNVWVATNVLVASNVLVAADVGVGVVVVVVVVVGIIVGGADCDWCGCGCFAEVEKHIAHEDDADDE
jgi:hypothetical protein